MASEKRTRAKQCTLPGKFALIGSKLSLNDLRAVVNDGKVSDAAKCETRRDIDTG